MMFAFVKEMPKQGSRNAMDIISVLGPVFFSWVVLQLFPVSKISSVLSGRNKFKHVSGISSINAICSD